MLRFPRPPRPPRGLSRRRLLASLLLFALFPLGLSAQEKIRIVTKTELHSANWIWSEEQRKMEYSEFDDGRIFEGKAKYPDDLARKTIGIGEIINLRLKEVSAGNPAGDMDKAKWEIFEGAGWAGFSGKAEGAIVQVGAKVLDGVSPRTVKVRVTTDTTPALTAEVELTIVKPDGIPRSRHCGPPPSGADVPDSANHQFGPGEISPSNCGAITKLVVIPMPTNVNFGGGYQGGVYTIERDVSSPPDSTTFTPPGSILFSDAQHDPALAYIKTNAYSAFFDTIGISRFTPIQTISEQHTCTWTCEFRWRDADGANTYNTNAKTKTTEKGGVPLLPHLFQRFWINHKSGAGATQILTTKISKFNSSVTRDTGAADSTRDIENNWKP